MSIFDLKVDGEDFLQELEEIDAEQARKVPIILNVTGQTAIAYLRSHTAEMRPPAHRGGPSRPAHPGHWADVTGDLARNYRYLVAGQLLSMENLSDHAIFLEDRDGFWVLPDIFTMDKFLREAIARVAPEWSEGSEAFSFMDVD